MNRGEANFKNLDKTYYRRRDRKFIKKPQFGRKLLMQFIRKLKKEKLLVRYSVEEDGEGNAKVLYDIADKNDRN